MLLAMDTSTEHLGLALFDGHQVLSEVWWYAGRRHTQSLAPWIRRLLDTHAVKPEDLKAIAVATGPGSFTGLRAGMALAKAMALAQGVPLVGVFSLDVTVAGVPRIPQHMLLAVLPMGRGRLAAGWYRWRRDHWHAEGPPFLATPEELPRAITEPTLVVGEMSPEARTLLERHPRARVAPPPLGVRRAAWLAYLGWERFQKGLVDDPVTLTPYYLSKTSENLYESPGGSLRQVSQREAR